MPSTGLVLEGSGSGDAGQEIWKPAMQTYLAGLPAEPFAQPPNHLVYGDQPQFGGWPGGQAGDQQDGPNFWERLFGNRRGR